MWGLRGPAPGGHPGPPPPQGRQRAGAPGEPLQKSVAQSGELWTQGLTFSPEGRQGLAQATLGRLERALAALATGDRALAQEVERQHPELLARLEASRQAHLQRLRHREESRASTLTHLDLLLLLEELNEGVNRLARLVGELKPPVGGGDRR